MAEGETEFRKHATKRLFAVEIGNLSKKEITENIREYVRFGDGEGLTRVLILMNHSPPMMENYRKMLYRGIPPIRNQR